MSPLITSEKFSKNFPIAKETIELLQKSLQIETVNPPGNEIRLAEYYKNILDEKKYPNIKYKIIETAKRRGNLIITWIGTEPLNRKIWAFASHLDVVPTGNLKMWKHSPFSGKIVSDEHDDFIWGRGAMDMKNIGVALLRTLMILQEEGFQPKSTIKIIFEADEEISGLNGIVPLIENHWDLISHDYFITEGGGFELPMNNFYAISTSEKGKVILKITASGATGHGSAPGNYSEFALFKLSKLLQKIKRYNVPITITLEFKKMIEAMPFPFLIKKMICSKYLVRGILKAASLFLGRDSTKKLHGLVSPSIAPTILHVGEKENVISSDGYLICDIRMLPRQDDQDMIQLIKKIAGKKLMRDLIIEKIDYVSPTSSLIDTEAYQVLEDVLKEMNPDAKLVPIIMPGGTDGRRLRMNGQIAYGFALFRSDKDLSYSELVSMPHSPNERVSVTNLMLTTEYYYRLFQKL